MKPSPHPSLISLTPNTHYMRLCEAPAHGMLSWPRHEPVFKIGPKSDDCPGLHVETWLTIMANDPATTAKADNWKGNTPASHRFTLWPYNQPFSAGIYARLSVSYCITKYGDILCISHISRDGRFEILIFVPCRLAGLPPWPTSISRTLVHTKQALGTMPQQPSTGLLIFLRHRPAPACRHAPISRPYLYFSLPLSCQAQARLGKGGIATVPFANPAG